MVFSAWSAALGKILTMDNLRNRHFIVVNRCCLCKLSRESVDRLLFHCEVANVLWNAFFSCFVLSLVMPFCVADLFAYWWTGGCSRSVVMWKMVPFCLMWSMWRENKF